MVVNMEALGRFREQRQKQKLPGSVFDEERFSKGISVMIGACVDVYISVDAVDGRHPKYPVIIVVHEALCPPASG